MSRGTHFSTALIYLKAELRDSQSANAVMDAEYYFALVAKQKDLALAYDWPFLKRYWDLPCAAGDRYKDIPITDTRGTSATINFERPLLVERLYNSRYNVIEYGIDSEHWNYRNGDVNERVDSIMRWQLATNTNETSNEDQIEIWPTPAAAQTLRFTGQRNVQEGLLQNQTGEFVLNEDGSFIPNEMRRFDLDDYLLVYFVAADYLAHRNQSNAPIVARKAAEHLLKLRAGYPTGQETINFGRRCDIYKPRTVPLVLVAS